MNLLKTITFLLIIVMSRSCVFIPKNNFHWAKMKSEFPFSEMNVFAIDTFFLNNLKKYPKANTAFFANILGKGRYYLYSWQGTDSVKDEFTIVQDETMYEQGFSIHYFIVDKKGEPISREKVAGKAGEGGRLYEVYSKIAEPKIIIRTEAITQKSNSEVSANKILRGDTTIKKIEIHNSGRTIITEINKIKMLEDN